MIGFAKVGKEKTMSDLISRHAAIETLKNMYEAAEKWRCEAKDEVIKARAESCMASLIEMKLRIEKLPSAQPERKTGKWIDDNCSVCGFYVHHGDARNFCPNCGADMRGDENEMDS